MDYLSQLPRDIRDELNKYHGVWFDVVQITPRDDKQVDIYLKDLAFRAPNKEPIVIPSFHTTALIVSLFVNKYWNRVRNLSAPESDVWRNPPNKVFTSTPDRMFSVTIDNSRRDLPLIMGHILSDQWKRMLLDHGLLDCKWA